MKKVFQIKLKNITRVMAMVIVTSLVTFTGCKNYDDDITTLQGKIDALKTEVNASITTQIGTLTAEINALKTKVTALETNGATDAEVAAAITAAKADILSKTVTIEAFNAYKATVTAELATKITAAQLDAKIVEVNAAITALGGKVTALETKVDAKVAELATADGQIKARLAILEGLLNVANGKSVVLDGFTTQLAAQLALINTNKDAIATFQAQLTTLLASSTKTVADIAKINANMQVLVSQMNLRFAALSNRLTSLVLVPTMYVNGVEAINFSPLSTPCSYSIIPSVTVMYHLNPSFITEADIDKDNLAFVVQATKNVVTKGLFLAKSAQDAVQVKAIFKKIEGGKIYVDVKVEDILVLAQTITPGATSFTETFNSIALQVPLSKKAVQENNLVTNATTGEITVGTTTYPSSYVVTSDYVRLYNDNYVYTSISLNRKDLVSKPAYPTTLQGAKDLKVNGVDGWTGSDDITIVHLPYGEGNTINLIDYVTALYNNAAFDFTAYNLTYSFDLKTPNSGNTADEDITYNRVNSLTNQQQFIELTNASLGTVKAKVYTQAQIAAAQGRTPIVRVKYMNGTCILKTAYIKLYLDEKPAKPAVTVTTFDLGSTTDLCANVDKVFTTAQIMNEKFYNLVGLSKEEFVSIYTLAQPGPGNLNNDGTFAEVTDLLDPTTSNLLKWSVSSATIWTKIGSGNSFTFMDSAVFVPKQEFKTLYGPINFAVKFVASKPASLTLTDNNKILEYWFDVSATEKDVYVKHNIEVPNVGETDKTKGKFANDLAGAFTVQSLAGLTSPSFYFHATQPYGFTVANAGKDLMFGSDLVAYITGTVLNLNNASPKAKELLNVDVTNLYTNIGIKANYCNGTPYDVTISGKNYFPVKFVRPITATVTEGSKFIDGKDFGDVGTILNVKDMVSFKDWRDFAFTSTSTYFQYYGITSIVVDGAIKTNLNQTLATTFVDLVTNFPKVEVTPVGTYPTNTLTYKNNNTILNSGFKLEVPITVSYYWGEIKSAKIYIDVEKTIGGSGIRKK